MGLLSDNTKLRPRNREWQRHWEHQAGQGSSTPIKHTFPQRCLALQKDSPLSYRKETENSGLGPLRETPEGGDAQLECDAPDVAVMWSYGDVLAGSKEFHGRSWKRALCCICRPVGKNFPGIWCVAGKSAEIFIGNLDEGRAGQLFTGQHPVG